MKSLVLSEGAATLIRRGKPVHISLEAVVGRIPVDSEVEMDEQIFNPTVHVDGELGVAVRLIFAPESYALWWFETCSKSSIEVLNVHHYAERTCLAAVPSILMWQC